ncbi:hypothetical protein N7509_000668 [Penicillium cosmopolitanum]|uniref:Aminotransferase class I/classII large domain-containing protein n=1 Tax=Penicillium cosmopolitanum TaxID=1131564 RepID=A0A9W9WB13_9EURO|nr:uncharacterized protein N7509_000668 [Penicillium cosmopolitanum]KAJ5414041.1 hypothetical protein N7509_000668 [Penicillium cosmopolitanum]
MHSIASFELPTWLQKNEDAKTILSGSATPALSIKDLIELSTDKPQSTENLSLDNIPLALGSGTGSEALRSTIATLFNDKISAANILTTNGATGANSLIFQTLLRAGDHVISMYPSYTQLLDMPQAITGTQVSLWKLNLDSTHQQKDQEAAAAADVAADLLDINVLKTLIKPNTKIIVLNNPNNPTGTMLSPNLQREILSLAHSHGIFVVVDEIFRPLYHGPKTTPLPPSFAEIDSFDNAIITGSLSKAWGLAGVRVGWIATRSETFMRAALNTRLYTINAISTLDEIVASEALSPRCRPQILAKHLNMARVNLEILDGFVDGFSSVVSMVRPFAGATAFLRIVLDGGPVDDVEFCHGLKEETGVLLAPGSRCFGVDGSGEELRGFVRIHITGSSDVFRSALAAFGGYLERIR